ncbi:MAG: TolC family protein [Chitinophagaceae bacterium]|nr:MAG: TolC family protein [Chitinophagaceae bacterium]
MRKLIGLLFFGIAFTTAYAQKKWSLQDCVMYARQHNISVKQADIQARLDQLSVDQNKLANYPSFDFSTGTGIQFGRSIDPTSNQFTNNQVMFVNGGLNLGMDLFNWFRKKNTLAASKYTVQASIAMVEKIKDDIALNVANGYLTALLSKERISISKVQMEQSKSQFLATESKVKNGVLPELNLLEMKTQLSKDSANYLDAIAGFDLSILQLKAILNIDAAEPFDIETPPVALIHVEPLENLAPNDVYQSSLTLLPQQKINKLLLEAAKKNVLVAKSSMYPSISFFGGASTMYSDAQKRVPSSFGYSVDSVGYANFNNQKIPVFVGNASVTGYDKNGFFTQMNHNFSQNIGINLRVPIFNSGSAKTQWKRAKLNVENQELVNEQDAQKLKQDIYQAHANAVAAKQKYLSNLATVEIASETFEASKKRYDVGLLSSIDLITNQNNVYNAKINLILSQYDYVFKMKLLEFYKGMGIKL